jgi:transposase
MGKKRKRYTADFKVEAASLALREGMDAVQVSRDLGVHLSSLRRWMHDLEDGRLDGGGSSKISGEALELKRLREENRQLRMERDILKKATAFFANQKS